MALLHSCAMFYVINVFYWIVCLVNYNFGTITFITFVDKTYILSSSVRTSLFKKSRHSSGVYFLSLWRIIQQQETPRCLLHFYLILILLEPKIISLCHQYRARPACISVPSDQAFFVSCPSSSFHLDIPKYDNRQFQKWKIDYSI